MEITCDNCNNSTELERTKDIPKEVHGIRCNYCPECEDQMDDYWIEYFVDENGKEMTFNYDVNGNVIIEQTTS